MTCPSLLHKLFRNLPRQLQHSFSQLGILYLCLLVARHGQRYLQTVIDLLYATIPTHELLEATDQERHFVSFSVLAFVEVTDGAGTAGFQGRDVQVLVMDMQKHDLEKFVQDLAVHVLGSRESLCKIFRQLLFDADVAGLVMDVAHELQQARAIGKAVKEWCLLRNDLAV